MTISTSIKPAATAEPIVISTSSIPLRGPRGLSPYEEWQTQGNAGTYQDFLNSIGGGVDAIPSVTIGQLASTHLAAQNFPGQAFCTDVGDYVRSYPSPYVWKKSDGTVVARDPVPATGVTIIPNPASLKIGKTLQLTAVVSPDTASQAVTWASSNPHLVISSSGVVSAVDGSSVGETGSITATEVGGQSGSTAVTVIASDVLKSVATWANIATDSVGSANGYTRCYMPVLVVTGSGDVKGLVPRYLGFMRRFDQDATVPLSAMTMVEAAYERYDGVATAPVTKDGGRAFVVPSGSYTDGDIIAPASLGFNNTTGIPVGTKLWHKMIFDIPVGGKIAASVRLFYGQSNVPGYFYGSGTTMPSVDTMGVANPTGTAPEALAYPFGPITCGYFVDPTVKAFCIDGDSIAAGQGDDNSFGDAGMGFLNRAMAKFDVPMASVNIACPGITAGKGLTDPLLAMLMGLGPDGYVLNIGTNNGNDPLAFTAAQTIALTDQMIARYKALPTTKVNAKVAVCKLLPRTYDSTGAYFTDDTQQIYNAWGPGEFSAQLNALMVTSKYDAVIQQDISRSSTDPFKWSGANGKLPADGTHLGGVGSGLLSIQAAVVLKALWMS